MAGGVSTDKGVSAVSVGKSDHALETALFGEYPAAEIHRDKGGLGEYVTAVLKGLGGYRWGTETKQALLAKEKIENP